MTEQVSHAKKALWEESSYMEGPQEPRPGAQKNLACSRKREKASMAG